MWNYSIRFFFCCPQIDQRDSIKIMEKNPEIPICVEVSGNLGLCIKSAGPAGM